MVCLCEDCGLTGRQRGVVEAVARHYGAAPFVLPRLRWSRARGVENPRTARLMRRNKKVGPGRGAAASFVCASLHAIDAT